MFQKEGGGLTRGSFLLTPSYVEKSLGSIPVPFLSAKPHDMPPINCNPTQVRKFVLT